MTGFTARHVQPEKRHGTDVLADRQLNLLLQGKGLVVRVIPVVENLIIQLVAFDNGRADMPTEDGGRATRADEIA